MVQQLTVVTATYNRVHTLPMVYESLKHSTYKNFIWMVVDDGSTDNTEEYINSLIANAPFEIQYVKKEHAGKYEACNLSYKLTKTPYMINCDSDDEMLPEGLEIIMKAWETVPAEQYDKIWCVTGRCIDSETREIVGGPFPKNINQLTGRKKWKAMCNVTGEKHSCRKVDVLKQFPFPTFKDTTKLVPNIVWTRINALYEQWCINDPISVYYQNSPDSLAKSTSKERLLAYYYYALMVINDYNDQFWYNSDIRRSYIDITRCGWRGGKKTGEILKSLNTMPKKIAVIICMPASALLNLYTEKVRKWIRNRKKH